MKGKLITILALLIYHSALSQYRKLEPVDMLIRKWVAFKVDFTQDEIIIPYLKHFDKDFNDYKSNEFKLRQKKDEAISLLNIKKDFINETEVFIADVELRFEEYDFDNEMFLFKPFFKTTETNEPERQFMIEQGIPSSMLTDNNLECAVRIGNLDMVDGLPMNKSDAQKFLDERTQKSFGSTSVNRVVYGRVYYVLDLSKQFPYNNRWTVTDDCLYGIALKVEVWDDKCRIKNQISVYGTSEVEPKFASSLEYLASQNNTEQYQFKDESNDYRRYMWWWQYNDNCEKELFEVHGKLLPPNKNLSVLNIRMFTNYRYKIFPGFTIEFYNNNTKKRLILPIQSVVKDETDVRLSVNLTHESLTQILNNDYSSFKIQLLGEASYNISGTGVEKKGTISRQVNYADYIMDEEARELFFSILKKTNAPTKVKVKDLPKEIFVGRDFEMVQTVVNRINHAIKQYFQIPDSAFRETRLHFYESKNIDILLKNGDLLINTGTLPITQNQAALAIFIAYIVADDKIKTDKLTSSLSHKERVRKSDLLGLRLAAIAGYNPNEAIGFWERMNRMWPIGSQPELVQLHPVNNEDLKKDVEKALEYFKPIDK